MVSLKDKTILIGKSPSDGNLLIAVAETGKTYSIGSPGCVPGSVSRCKPNEGVAHAKLTINSSGHMILTNLKPRNATYVNGSEIVSKAVGLGDSIELGKDHFKLALPMVIESAKKISTTIYSTGNSSPQSHQAQRTQQEIKKFNIKHLEAIYEDYRADVIKRQRKQKNLGILASCSMLFSVGGAAVAGLSTKLGMGESTQNYLWILSVIGFIVLLISLYMRIRDKSIEEADATNLEYTRHFICPNPECEKFLGNMPYELMKRQYSMHCPYCKCEFVEE